METDKKFVTDIEHLLEDNNILVSKTDLNSHIVEANRPFIRLSGYTEQELIGSPHNLVRHPDMPSEAFQDLWRCLKSGKPWLGYVKNRCKNGDYYWVEANVSPVYEAGKIQGYLSVRSKPDRKTLEEVERLYQQINSGEKTLRPRGLLARFRVILRDLPKQGLMFVMLGLPVFALVMQQVLGVNDALINSGINLGVATYLMGVAYWIKTGLFTPLKSASAALLRMSEGNFQDQYDIRRNDEIGKLFQSIKIMQNNQRAHLAKERAMFVDGQRYKQSLDNAQSNVMIVDRDLNVSYVNPALRAMLERHKKGLLDALPNLPLKALEGKNITCFKHAPLDTLTELQGLSRSKEQDITIADLTFALTMSPVFDADNKRIGTVIEWRERITELAVVEEIKAIVSSVKNGDLTQQITLEDKSGFFLALCGEINEMVETIAASFDDIAKAMGSVANGDLTQKITTERSGTYAAIQQDINRTVDHLQRTIDQIIKDSQFFQRASEEIVGDNTDLAQRTDEQAHTLQNTSVAMSQLTLTVSNNADNAQQANAIASEAQCKAQRGGEVVKQAGHAMQEISQSSQKIEEITGVIDEIAFQTNLLALNASVEAARAGAHGKGFAVVATEVRELASRSARAAREIKDLITDSGTKVKNGTQLVFESHTTLEEIVESVSQVGALISDIASASSEQAQGINDINDSVLVLDDTTCKNASLAEMVTNSSRKSFDKANEMVEMLSFFKTR